jgi:hypothetical protein
MKKEYVVKSLTEDLAEIGVVGGIVIEEKGNRITDLAEIEKQVLGLIHNIPHIDEAMLYAEIHAYSGDVDKVIKDLISKKRITKNKKSNGYWYDPV